MHVLQLEGKLPHKEKGILTGEYSKRYDKSRYVYLLDAPFEVSHMCCGVMKKKPLKRYVNETKRNPMTAQMAAESRLRTQKWLQNGCNAFDAKRLPLKTTGCTRTGCMFCGFGCHLEKSPNRFERMAETHPKLLDYVMRGGAFDKEDGLWKPNNRGLGFWFVLKWINVHGNFNIAIPNYEQYEQEYGTELTREYLIKKERDT